MLLTSGDPLPSLRGNPQPALALVEAGEGLREERSETEGREDTVERSETEGREDTVEIEEALVDMVKRG